MTLDIVKGGSSANSSLAGALQSSKRKQAQHQQLTLGPPGFTAVAAASSSASTTCLQAEKKRRISTGWDDMCRTTVRAHQAEEKRRRQRAASSSISSSSSSSSISHGVLPSNTRKASIIPSKTATTQSSTMAAQDRPSMRAEGSRLRKCVSPLAGFDHVDAWQDASNEGSDFQPRVVPRAVKPELESTMDSESDDQGYQCSRRRSTTDMRGSGFQDTRLSWREMRGRLKQGRPVRPSCTTLAVSPTRSTPSYLSMFVSHNIYSVYRVEPNPSHLSPTVREWSPVYACAYSHAAKDGWSNSRQSLAALGTESGGVRIIDTQKSDVAIQDTQFTSCRRKRHFVGFPMGTLGHQGEETQTHQSEETLGQQDQEARHSRQTSTATTTPRRVPRPGHLACHNNAIFDIKWSQDDGMLVTGCADQTSTVWDTTRFPDAYTVEPPSGAKVAQLMGHTASVKTSIWVSPVTLATAGRDGDVHIYDLRTSGGYKNVDLDGASEAAPPAAEWNKRAAVGRGSEDDGEKIWPVLSIRNAHGKEAGKKSKGVSLWMLWWVLVEFEF